MTIPVTIVALATLGGGGAASAQFQSDAQQRCIRGVNAATRVVARAQAENSALCLYDPNAATIESCLTDDAAGLKEKARLKLERTIASKCATAPDFGVTTAETASASAMHSDIGLFHDVFGSDLTAAMSYGASDPRAALCQRVVHKTYSNIFQAQLKEFEACKKAGLKSGAITSPTSLADCMDAIFEDPEHRILKKQNRLGYALERCDGVDLSEAFPGRCAQAVGTNCIQMRGSCRACLLFNTADGLNAPCDLIDDGNANGTCGCGDGSVDGEEQWDD
jgi:hypothetical protein